MSPPGALAVAWEIFCKDVRVEKRTGEIIATAGVFSMVVGFVASMAFHVDDRTNPAMAAGTLWLTLFFSATLSFSRVWQREREESALTGLLVAPISRAAIFVGKAAAAFAIVTIVQIPLVALCMFLFQVNIFVSLMHCAFFVGLLTMGTAALCLVGTLFGVMSVRTGARDLVLAIVLFPLLSPVLVCGVAGTRRMFELQPLDAFAGFVQLMLLAAFVAAVLGAGLFGALVDDA